MGKEIKLVLSDEAYKAVRRQLTIAWLCQSDSPLIPLWDEVITSIEDGQEVHEVKTSKEKAREKSLA